MKSEENKKILKYSFAVLVVAVLCISFCFAMYRNKSVSDSLSDFISILNPFIFGGVLAYLTAPLCKTFEKLLAKIFKKDTKRTKSLIRCLAIFLTLFTIMLIISLLLMLVLPQLGRSIYRMVNVLPSEIAAANAQLHDFLQKYPDAQKFWDDISSGTLAKVESWLKDDLFPTAQILIGGVGSQLIGVVNFFKTIIIGVIAAVYFLWSRKTLLTQAKMLLKAVFPPKWEMLILEEVRYADRMFSGFLVGKIVDSLIIAIICFICTNIMNLNFSMLISTIIGVTNIIPFFGPIIGAVPCLLLLLLEKPIQCVYFLIFILILQQVDGQIIGPRILGKSIGISGFWVLFSIILFGGLYGFLGMVVGVPLFAVIYDIVRKLVHYGLKRRESETAA